jgi:hypothetical protein
VTRIDGVALHGNRAVVTCTVRQDWEDFHNIRLFACDYNEWRLLAWANERAGWFEP